MVDLRIPDINTVLIAGNLTRDPSFRSTTNGTPVTNFWIASNRRFKDNNGNWRENVCYVGVVAWYKLAENCAQNLKKGSAVLVEGEMQSRSLRSNDGRNRNIVEIKARRVQFLSKRDDDVEEDEEPVEVADLQDDFEETATEDKEPEEEQIQPDNEADDNPMKGKFDFGYQNIEL